MKFYITEETKQELENKIKTLEKTKHETNFTIEWNEAVVMINLLKDVLSSSTILPVEESWKNIKDLLDINTLPITYKNGVVIQSK
jgi:hypothetical protein